MKKETLLIFAIALATLVSCTPLDTLENVDEDDEVDLSKVHDEPLEPGVRNWKECTWNKINLTTKAGRLIECSFRKISKASFLNVQVVTNLKVRAWSIACRRWYVTFDGKECKSVPIDGMVLMHQADGPVYRPQEIAGHCKINKAGTVKVALNIGDCYGMDYDYASTAVTGWNSATRIYLEEIQPPQ